ncbi:Mitochondrial oxaloacetate carrier protein [Pestalotiopsis sp. IQ-011]
MKDYTAKMGRISDEIRFIAYDGSRLVEDDTVESLELEDGDLIDVMDYQEGGA